MQRDRPQREPARDTVEMWPGQQRDVQQEKQQHGEDTALPVRQPYPQECCCRERNNQREPIAGNIDEWRAGKA